VLRERIVLSISSSIDLTFAALSLLRSHDQRRIAREVVCVLLVGDCGVGDGVEALEERGEAGFEGAVFGDGGDVLLGHDCFGFLLGDGMYFNQSMIEWCGNKRRGPSR
jgi:hypothetical protein